MVGEGQGRLPQLGRPGHQLLDAAAAVQEREVRVDVQVDEGRRGVGRWFRPPGAASLGDCRRAPAELAPRAS